MTLEAWVVVIAAALLAGAVVGYWIGTTRTREQANGIIGALLHILEQNGLAIEITEESDEQE